MKQKRVVRSIFRLGKRAEIISLVWISMFRYTILSEIGKKNKKGEKLPLSAIGQKILFNYDLLRPLFCPTKKYNSIHVQSYIVSHKKLLIDPKLRRIFIQHLCQSFMLIKQIWSHFFQKSVSQNKIKNNRGDIIFMIQASLSFLCNVDERNRCDVSLQFCLVFRLFYLPFSNKNYVTLHWLQKWTVSGIQLLKHLCFFTKLYLFIVFFIMLIVGEKIDILSPLLYNVLS